MELLDLLRGMAFAFELPAAAESIVLAKEDCEAILQRTEAQVALDHLPVSRGYWHREIVAHATTIDTFIQSTLERY